MNKKRIIIAVAVVVLLIIAIFVGFIVYKVSVLNNLVAKGLETKALRNYYTKIEQEVDNGTDIEVWAKDNEHFLVKVTEKTNGGLNMVMYRNGNEQLKASEVRGLKGITRKNASLIEMNTLATYMAPNPSVKEVLKTLIRSVKIEDKDCYEITLENNTTVWIEKETALVIKVKMAEGITNYIYEIGTVTDADVQKPDLTGYTEMN